MRGSWSPRGDSQTGDDLGVVLVFIGAGEQRRYSLPAASVSRVTENPQSVGFLVGQLARL